MVIKAPPETQMQVSDPAEVTFLFPRITEAIWGHSWNTYTLNFQNLILFTMFILSIPHWVGKVYASPLKYSISWNSIATEKSSHQYDRFREAWFLNARFFICDCWSIHPPIHPIFIAAQLNQMTLWHIDLGLLEYSFSVCHWATYTVEHFTIINCHKVLYPRLVKWWLRMKSYPLTVLPCQKMSFCRISHLRQCFVPNLPNITGELRGEICWHSEVSLGHVK